MVRSVLAGLLLFLGASWADAQELGPRIPLEYRAITTTLIPCRTVSPHVYQRTYGIGEDLRLITYGVVPHPPVVFVHFAPGEGAGIVTIIVILPGRVERQFPTLVALQEVMNGPCDLLRLYPARQHVA